MKTTIIKLLVGRKLGPQAIKFLSAILAGAIITRIATAPEWMVNLLADSGIRISQDGTALVIAIILSELLQGWVDKQNAAGVKEIQEEAQEKTDSYAGDHTVRRIRAMANEIRILREELEDLRPIPPPAPSGDTPPSFPTSLKPPGQ